MSDKWINIRNLAQIVRFLGMQSHIWQETHAILAPLTNFIKRFIFSHGWDYHLLVPLLRDICNQLLIHSSKLWMYDDRLMIYSDSVDYKWGIHSEKHGEEFNWSWWMWKWHIKDKEFIADILLLMYDCSE